MLKKLNAESQIINAMSNGKITKAKGGFKSRPRLHSNFNLENTLKKFKI